MSRRKFNQLKAFRHILVTGPQRSGTTICAAMLAKSLGKAFCPDEAIGQDNIKTLEGMVGKSEFVLQCPALLPRIHELSFDNTAVAIMRRAVGSINLSINRIEWDGGAEEIERYRNASDEVYGPKLWSECLGKYADKPSFAIAAYKYEIWERIQVFKMKMPTFTIHYSSLFWHPMWIESVERKSFDPRQISHEHANATQERIP